MRQVLFSMVRNLLKPHNVATVCRRYMALHRNNKNSKLLTSDHSLLANTEVFVFDCDGVIWKGDSLIDGAVETLSKLRELEKKVYFVTNSSTRSREGFQKKFNQLGISVQLSEMLCSSFAAARYLQRNPLPPGKKVFVIGHEGIEAELSLAGIPFVSGSEFNNRVVKLGPGVKIEQDPDVAAVVVGVDRDINYYKIQYAQLCISENPGCRFIATNMDAVAHATPEQEWAGAGAMVGAIRGCTGVEPILVGKPSSLLIDYIMDECKVERNRICMVGDRLDTDVLFGLQNGLQTVLTLSGVTTKEKLFSETNRTIPHFYVKSIADLVC